MWAPGDHADPPADPEARLMRAVPFFRGDLPNVYDRPIEGVSVTVDMNKQQVVSFSDTGIVPVNTTITGNASAEQSGLTALVLGGLKHCPSLNGSAHERVIRPVERSQRRRSESLFGACSLVYTPMTALLSRSVRAAVPRGHPRVAATTTSRADSAIGVES
jgi:hypothetical protein